MIVKVEFPVDQWSRRQTSESSCDPAIDYIVETFLIVERLRWTFQEASINSSEILKVTQQIRVNEDLVNLYAMMDDITLLVSIQDPITPISLKRMLMDDWWRADKSGY